MAVQGAVVTLSTGLTASALAGDGVLEGRGILRVWVRNRGTGTAYLGGSTVASTDGYTLSSGAEVAGIVLQPWDVLYGISSGTAPVLEVLRVGETT